MRQLEFCDIKQNRHLVRGVGMRYLGSIGFTWDSKPNWLYLLYSYFGDKSILNLSISD